MEQHWVLYLLLLTAMVVSLGLTVLQLPGLWLILLFALGYAWATDWAYLGIFWLLLLFLLALVAEVLESLAAAGGAAKAGSTKTAMALAILGAFIGGVAFTFLLPVPIVGTLIGVVAGAFGGAYAGDQVRGRSQEQSVRSGIGAAIGRLVGTLIKVVFGIVMLLVTAFAAIPWEPVAPIGTAGEMARPTVVEEAVVEEAVVEEAVGPIEVER